MAKKAKAKKAKKAKRSTRKSKRVIQVKTRALAQAIVREVKAARQAVAVGERAVAKANKAGNAQVAARNQKALDRARRVLAALESALVIALPQKRKAGGPPNLTGGCPFDGLFSEPFTFE
jgi:hypothetical protein